MSLIRPFAGLRPVPAHAEDVVAPPYDVLNSEEARQRAAGRPWSFLHISKAEIDLPEGTDPYDAAVYAKAAENLQKMLDAGVLRRNPQPAYYVYRLTMGEHVQTGLVAVASVAAYDANRIRKHEFTRPAKEDDRVRQIEALNAQTGPVLLAYKSQPDVDQLIASVTAAPPEYDLMADDGIGHTFWVVNDAAVIDRLTAAFDAMPAIYIADGHHRSAAASRVAAALNRGPESWGFTRMSPCSRRSRTCSNATCTRSSSERRCRAMANPVAPPIASGINAIGTATLSVTPTIDVTPPTPNMVTAPPRCFRRVFERSATRQTSQRTSSTGTTRPTISLAVART